MSQCADGILTYETEAAVRGGQYGRGYSAGACLPTDEDDANRLGEKVILREQVKELFNEKYGQCSLVLPCGRGGSTGWLS